MVTLQHGALGPLGGDCSFTAVRLPEEDRQLLESKGVQIAAGPLEQTWTCTFSKGTRTLPPKNTELFNQEGTRVVGMFLERYFVLDGDILVLVVTWFDHPAEGPPQERETRISVLGSRPTSRGAQPGEGGAPT